MIDIFNERQKQILLLLFRDNKRPLDQHDMNIIGLVNAGLIENYEGRIFKLTEYGKEVVAHAVSRENLL